MFCLDAMADLYNWINPKTGKHSPMISEEVHNIIKNNADVCSFSFIKRILKYFVLL